MPAEQIVASDIGHTTLQSLQAAAHEMARSWAAFRVPRVGPLAQRAHRGDGRAISGSEAYVSATPTSADETRGSRARGYLRETFAYLYYRLFGG